MNCDKENLWAFQTNKAKFAALFILMLPVLLVTIDNTILGFALPKLSEALHPSASQQLWMIDAYSLILAGLLIVMGTLADRLGHRNFLLIGCSGFTLVSVLTALSETAVQLIAGRALLGVFGAMLLPSTLALIRCLFTDREQLRVAVAVWATTLTVGSALGPLVGGVLLEHFSWNAIFLIALPILLPVLLLGPLLLPESDKSGQGSIDAQSVWLSISTMTTAVFAIKHIATAGLDGFAVTLLVAALCLGGVFVRRQLRLSTPFMDLTLFRNPVFTGSIAVNLLSLGLLVGFVFFATQMLQIVLGLSPFKASLALVPGQVMAVFMGVAIVPVARRVAIHWLIPCLLGLAAAAFMWVAIESASLSSIIVGFALLSISVGAIATVSNDVMLSAAQPSKAGAASAISETAYEVGVVLGTTVVGGLITALYRGALELPEGLTTDQRARAIETLAGAFRLADAQVMQAAGDAFVQGVTVASGWVSVMVVLAMFAGCWALKSRTREGVIGEKNA
jgi:DHA2 family multidrug resistance protein-like MFS transporter